MKNQIDTFSCGSYDQFKSNNIKEFISHCSDQHFDRNDTIHCVICRETKVRSNKSRLRSFSSKKSFLQHLRNVHNIYIKSKTTADRHADRNAADSAATQVNNDDDRTNKDGTTSRFDQNSDEIREEEKPRKRRRVV